MLAVLLLQPPAASARPAGEAACGSEPGLARALLALHRYWIQDAPSSATAHGAGDRDEDDVAILEDRGDLVASRRPFDLDGAAVRLAPNAAGGYDAARTAIAFDAPGTALGLGDDDARSVELPFAFPFYGARHTRVFVHADGHLTFGAPDVAPGDRGLGRLLAGPPRIAPFFANLDPGRGGSVSAQLGPDRAAFVWSGVPASGQINRNSFEAVLHPSGAIDFVYSQMQAREAVVGVSPGAAGQPTSADFSAAQPRGSSGALVERFSESEKLDLVAVVHRFLAGHADVFDQLVIYTTRPLNPVPGTLAFELNVRNDVRGIGLELLDDSAQWGSASRLSSVVFMDAIDPYLQADGFEILGHEVGHRWLARLRFRDASGADSGALLGRGGVHWSFFLQSDASVLEGNQIADLGGGRFETVDVARRFSALDQYAMGLRAPSEVPPFFVVLEPDGFQPNRGFGAGSSPEAGVRFTGVRKDVHIEQVVAAMGAREPPAERAPRVLRQGFVLVEDAEAPASEPRRRAVARIRARFESFYLEATGGRGHADTRLR
jgi:hypothetical protein